MKNDIDMVPYKWPTKFVDEDGGHQLTHGHEGTQPDGGKFHGKMDPARELRSFRDGPKRPLPFPFPDIFYLQKYNVKLHKSNVGLNNLIK